MTRRQPPEFANEAIECFKGAIALDPRFAAAHAGLANAYVARSIAAFTTSVQPPRTTIPLARAAAEQALSLAPDLSEAHGVLAHIACGYDWDWPAAHAAFRHALHLDPRNASVARPSPSDSAAPACPKPPFSNWNWRAPRIGSPDGIRIARRVR